MPERISKRRYQTKEAQFLQEVFEKFLGEEKGIMSSLLIGLSSLFKLIDKDPVAQTKTNEILNYIKENWTDEVRD